MVNHFTNINKMKNHLSLNTKKPRQMTLEIQVLALDRHRNTARLNWLMGYQLSHYIFTYKLYLTRDWRVNIYLTKIWCSRFKRS